MSAKPYDIKDQPLNERSPIKEGASVDDGFQILNESIPVGVSDRQESNNIKNKFKPKENQ